MFANNVTNFKFRFLVVLQVIVMIGPVGVLNAENPHQNLPYCHEVSLKEPRSLGSGEQYSEVFSVEQRKNCKKKLVVLAFLAGDNDLGYYILNDLAEMENALFQWNEIEKRTGRRPSLDLITQTDLPSGNPPRRHHIIAGQHEGLINNTDLLHSPLIETLDESNTGDFRVLESFLSWGVEQYPAEEYFVILGGHGYSYGHSQAGTRLIGGMLTDTPTLQRVYLDELSNLFTRVNNEKLNGHGFALLLNDACLMQELNTLSEIAKKDQNGVAPIRFAMGTETVHLGRGFDYSLLLSSLDELPEEDVTADQLVKYFAKKILSNVEEIESSESGKKVGFSLFSLATIEQELGGSLERLSSALINHFDTFYPEDPSRLVQLATELRNSSTLSIEFAGHRQRGLLDLGLFQSEIDRFILRKLEGSSNLSGELVSLKNIREKELRSFQESLLRAVPMKNFHQDFWNPDGAFDFRQMNGTGVLIGRNKRHFNSLMRHFELSPLYKAAPSFFSLVLKSY